jgi:hypothetical protein
MLLGGMTASSIFFFWVATEGWPVPESGLEYDYEKIGRSAMPKSGAAWGSGGHRHRYFFAPTN